MGIDIHTFLFRVLLDVVAQQEASGLQVPRAHPSGGAQAPTFRWTKLQPWTSASPKASHSLALGGLKKALVNNRASEPYKTSSWRYFGC